MREAIPFTALMKEVHFIFYIHLTKAEVFCAVFEDNQTCIAVAESNKLPPRTKQLSTKGGYSDMIH